MTALQSARKAALRTAHALREQFRNGGEFSLREYLIALADALREFQSEAYNGFVAYVAEQVDQQSTHERRSDQPELFDLEGELALGEGRRIAKRLALIEHADEAMANDDANLASVMQANVRKREELNRLRPYWSRPGITKQQAVATYLAEHPGSDSAQAG